MARRKKAKSEMEDVLDLLEVQAKEAKEEEKELEELRKLENPIRLVVTEDGKYHSLKTLLAPRFMHCDNCPIRSECTNYREGKTCILEQALYVEVEKHLQEIGVTEEDRLLLFSLYNVLFTLYRMYNAQPLVLTRDTFDEGEEGLFKKFVQYMKTLMTINKTYVGVLKELQATRKERKSKKEKTQNKFFELLSTAAALAEEEYALENELKEAPVSADDN